MFITGASRKISQTLTLHGTEHYYRIQVEKIAKGVVLFFTDVTDLNKAVIALKEDEKTDLN